MKKPTNLQWPERLALMNRFQPTDMEAATAFGVQSNEIAVARELQSSGTIVATTDIDCDQYAALFNSPDSIKAPTKPANPGLAGVVRESGKGQPPMSATKRVAEPKKRGRKGNNIAEAFAAIPTVAVPVEEFAKTHGVSVAVLRQSKRFDTTGGASVRVKKDKTTKVLMISRDSA